MTTMSSFPRNASQGMVIRMKKISTWAAAEQASQGARCIQS